METNRKSLALNALSGLVMLAAAAAAAVLAHNGAPPPHTTAAAPVAPASPSSAAAQPQVASEYGKLPISFEPNVGQASSDVKYVARGSGYSLALSEQGALLSLRQPGPKPGLKPAPMLPGKPEAARQAQLRLSLVHAQTQAPLSPERPQASLSNYFIGKDSSQWHSNVPNYGAVRYSQVYPGIDWVVYGNPQQLEYDLVVAPKADPDQIKLHIAGADRLALDANGDLLVQVQGQTLRQLKPVVYQTADDGSKQPVDGRYVLDREHDQVAFNLGRYDRSRQLVIDPALFYSTYLGGSSYDTATAIAVDSSGAAYVLGST